MKADQVVEQLSMCGWNDLVNTLQLDRVRYISPRVRLAFLTQVKDIVEHMPRAMAKYSVLLSVLVIACMESTEVSLCPFPMSLEKDKVHILVHIMLQ